MACARSESIFCWPRVFADFLCECFPVDEVWALFADLFVEETVDDLGLAIVVAGFAESAVELWPALAAEAHTNINAVTATAPTRVRLIPVNLLTITPQLEQSQIKPAPPNLATKRKSPTDAGIVIILD